MTTIINLNFKDESHARKAIRELQRDLRSGRFAYFPGVPLKTEEDYKDPKSEIYLQYDYAWKIGQSVRILVNYAWPSVFFGCIDTFFDLGACSLNILECMDDERAASSYYVDREKVSATDYYQSVFGSDFASAEFLEQNFFVGQRQKVTANLRSAKHGQTEKSGCYLEFTTDCDKQFLHHDVSDLCVLLEESHEPTVTFRANFELIKFRKKIKSYAIYPSELKLTKRRLTSVPEFTIYENRKFYKALGGCFVDEYINDYNADVEKVLFSLQPDSICNVPFENLLNHIHPCIDAGMFNAFGLEIYSGTYSSDRDADYFMRIFCGGHWLDDELPVRKVARHLKKNSIPIKDFDYANLLLKLSYVYAEWTSGSANISLKVHPSGFKIMVAHKTTEIGKLKSHY